VKLLEFFGPWAPHVLFGSAVAAVAIALPLAILAYRVARVEMLGGVVIFGGG